MENNASGTQAWNDFIRTSRSSIELVRFKRHICELKNMNLTQTKSFILKTTNEFSSCDSFQDCFEKKISEYVVSRLMCKTTDHESDTSFILNMFGVFCLAGHDIAFDLTNLNEWFFCSSKDPKAIEINANINFVCNTLFNLSSVWETIRLLMENFKDLNPMFSLEEHVKGKVLEHFSSRNGTRTNSEHLAQIMSLISMINSPTQSIHVNAQNSATSSASSAEVNTSANTTSNTSSCESYDPPSKRRYLFCLVNLANI
jgi:hypothetical protein